MYGNVFRRCSLVAACAIALALAAATSAFAWNDQAFAAQGQHTRIQAASGGDAQAAALATQRAALKRSVKDGLYLIQSVYASDYVVSAKGASRKAGAKVVLGTPEKDSWAQKWAIVRDAATGLYTIRNLNSRHALTVAGKAKSAATMKQAALRASKAQRWRIVKDGGTCSFISAANPKMALTAVKVKKGAPKFVLKPYKASEAQLFDLDHVEAIEDGHSFFIRDGRAKKALGVAGSSVKAKAKLAFESKGQKKSQRFRFVKSGSSYLVQGVASCMYMGVKNGVLRQFKSPNGRSKRWEVSLDLKTCAFTLESVLSGKRLDSKRATPKLKARSSGISQKFVLIPTYGFAVFVDAGHGTNGAGYGVYDPGAEGCGYEEADLTADLAKRIAKRLRGSDVRVFCGVDYPVPYWQRNSKARSLGCDAVVSIHFDADGGGSTSTMLGTHGKQAGAEALNRIIHARLVSSTGLSDGGTSYRGDITVVNGSVPAVLMEVCFIDNYSSLHKYLGRRNIVSKSLAEGIVEASRVPALQR